MHFISVLFYILNLERSDALFQFYYSLCQIKPESVEENLDP